MMFTCLYLATKIDEIQLNIEVFVRAINEEKYCTIESKHSLVTNAIVRANREWSLLGQGTEVSARSIHAFSHSGFYGGQTQPCLRCFRCSFTEKDSLWPNGEAILSGALDLYVYSFSYGTSLSWPIVAFTGKCFNAGWSDSSFPWDWDDDMGSCWPNQKVDQWVQSCFRWQHQKDQNWDRTISKESSWVSLSDFRGKKKVFKVDKLMMVSFSIDEKTSWHSVALSMISPLVVVRLLNLKTPSLLWKIKLSHVRKKPKCKSLSNLTSQLWLFLPRIAARSESSQEIQSKGKTKATLLSIGKLMRTRVCLL